MRFIAFSVLCIGAVVSAQELSPPPLPPDVTPDPVLPKTNDSAQPPPTETKGFTSAFSSRISFFSTNDKLHFDVSLGSGRERCKTPCSIDTNAGYSEITVVREGQRLTEEHLVPPGRSHLLIKSYSLPLITAGSVLMSLSATAVLVAVIIIALFPYTVFAMLLTAVAPAVLLAGAGIPLTAVGSRRPTTTFVELRDGF